MPTHRSGFKYVTDQWLAGGLQYEQRFADWKTIRAHNDHEGDGAFLEVRLQVVDGDAFVHSGDSSFDTDHRGFWGSSSIGEHDDWSTLLETAREMIVQAKDASIGRGKP